VRAARGIDVDRARKALGGEVPAEVEAWTATGRHAMSSRESSDWTAVVLKIDTPHGPAELAVSALLAEQMVGRVRLAGLPAGKTPSEFLRRFGGFEYATASLAEPAATLEAAQKKAAEAKDADATVLRALLAIRSAMCHLTPNSSVVVDRIQKKERKAAEAEAIQKIFEEMAKAADGLSFLKDESRRRLRDLSGVNAGQARTLAAALRAGDWKRADDAHRAIAVGCAACHGTYPRLLRPERARLGIGDGYFKVGFDLVPEPGADAKTLDAIAVGVRRAMVLLSHSR
jgi:hypothetical protein